LYLRYGLTDLIFFKYAILLGFLIPIFFIDAFKQIIPHVLSIPLIITGFIFSILPGNDIGIMNAFVTSLFVFCFLLLLAWGYQKMRGSEGLGGGDIWLLTGISAYFGITGIPYIFLLSAILGIVYFLIFIRDKDKPFAFGTFIAVAAVLWALIGEQTILDWIPFI
jgi:leader peptidase (prepilin peptidase)/N-methyltransferase